MRYFPGDYVPSPYSCAKRVPEIFFKKPDVCAWTGYADKSAIGNQERIIICSWHSVSAIP